MNELNKIIENVTTDKLSECELLIKQILAEKLNQKLKEEREKFSFSEQEGRMKFALRVTRPQSAFKSNLQTRKKLENKLDSISRKI